MDTVATITKVLTEAERVVDGIRPDQLANPSPCSDWTVRDVLNHVTGGAEMFSSAVRDGSVPDEKLAALTTGDNLGDDYKGSFHAAMAGALDVFNVPGAMERTVRLPFGEMPAGTALTFAIFDVTMHTWDLAKATGQSTALDPDILGPAFAVGQQMLGPEMRASGRFGPEVAVPEDAPLQDRLAGLAGRAP